MDTGTDGVNFPRCAVSACETSTAALLFQVHEAPGPGGFKSFDMVLAWSIRVSRADTKKGLKVHRTLSQHTKRPQGHPSKKPKHKNQKPVSERCAGLNRALPSRMVAQRFHHAMQPRVGRSSKPNHQLLQQHDRREYEMRRCPA